jgi:Rad3-related DNA helicase
VTFLPHQQRVVDEAHELGERITRLSAFLQTVTFNTLDEAERRRQRSQLVHMRSYYGILLERIEAFRA